MPDGGRDDQRKYCPGLRSGILQGISALLLTFDESEVRKIVVVCQHVLNHLSYVEMIESMDQLVDFVKVNHDVPRRRKNLRIPSV